MKFLIIIFLCLIIFNCFSWGVKINLQKQIDEDLEYKEILNEIKTTSKCYCTDKSLCKRIKTKPREEIVGYAINNTLEFFENYVIWENLTSIMISWDINTDPQILCLAHSKGVRVHHIISEPPGWNSTIQKQWIVNATNVVFENNLDGLNLDFEFKTPINETADLTKFVKKINKVLNIADPNIQLSYDIDVKPTDIDYLSITPELDYWMIMVYDESYNKSPLGPNSPFYDVVFGLKTFLDMGINPWNLVVAIPWYGYFGECLQENSMMNNTCTTPHYPSPPSLSYVSIENILKNYENSGRLWNSTSMTPYVNYKYQGNYYQVQYDDPISLLYKVAYSKTQNVRGIAVWTINCLDQASSETINVMYSVLSSFLE